MIEDIVVNLSIGNGGLTTADYAVSVASTLQAHITGIAMAFDPNISGSVIGYLPDDIIEAKRRDNEAAAQAAIASFAAATARAGVAAEPRMLRSTFDSAGNQFGRIARLFDLAIVDQAKTNGNVIETLIAESTLFESGRPVIVVPYVQRSPFKLDRVMVCWDGRGRPRAPSPMRCRSWSAPATSKWSSSRVARAKRTRSKASMSANTSLVTA